MRVTKERIEYTKDLLIFSTVRFIQRDRGISSEQALNEFMKSKTYELLQDSESRLWVESPEYVYDMYESELKGDIANWLDI